MSHRKGEKEGKCCGGGGDGGDVEVGEMSDLCGTACVCVCVSLSFFFWFVLFVVLLLCFDSSVIL